MSYRLLAKLVSGTKRRKNAPSTSLLLKKKKIETLLVSVASKIVTLIGKTYLDRPKYISGEFGRIFRARIPSARNVPEIYFGRFKGNLYVIRANSGAFRANLGTFRAISGRFGRIRAHNQYLMCAGKHATSVKI